MAQLTLQILAGRFCVTKRIILISTLLGKEINISIVREITLRFHLLRLLPISEAGVCRKGKPAVWDFIQVFQTDVNQVLIQLHINAHLLIPVHNVPFHDISKRIALSAHPPALFQAEPEKNRKICDGF